MQGIFLQHVERARRRSSGWLGLFGVAALGYGARVARNFTENRIWTPSGPLSRILVAAVALSLAGCTAPEDTSLSTAPADAGGAGISPDAGPPSGDDSLSADILEAPSDAVPAELDTLPKDAVPGDTISDIEASPDISDGAPDATQDTDAAAATDASPDTGALPADAATVAQTCVVDSDCESGLCAETPGGGQCAIPCDDGCPQNWTCGLVGTDFLCFPLHPTLCDPCGSKSDCAGFVGGADCVQFGTEGGFCGSGCDYGCPDGFDCQAVPRTDGSIGNHCVPADGAVCACSPKASAQGLATSCQRSNEFGTCEGTRACGAAGLGACLGPEPAAEACGGGDEDCDGEVDEEGALGCVTYFADNDNDGFGASGVSKCLCAPESGFAVSQGGDCDDEAWSVNPGVAEQCNDGVDDNCDNQADGEGSAGCVTYYFDNDQDGYGVVAQSRCLCAPEGKYSAPFAGDCDDTDPFLFPDAACQEPKCEIFIISGQCDAAACGEPLPATPCPDGFVCLDQTACRTGCTQDKHCQPGLHCDQGACVSDRPDGAPCTFDGQCLGGHCGGVVDGAGFCCAGAGACCGGLDAQCDDADPCAVAVCAADFTCVATPITDGASCGEALCDGETFHPEALCEAGVCVAGDAVDCGVASACVQGSCHLDGCTATPLGQGATCQASVCIGFEQLAPKTCDGSGACAIGGAATPCPGGYACAPDGAGCRTNCAVDAHCQPDAFCKQGVCIEQLAAGATCFGDPWCASGSCIGGKCCDGCCDTQTLGSVDYARAMEICGADSVSLEGPAQCKRVIADFGAFSHADRAPAAGDTAMVQFSTGKASSINNQQDGESLGTSGPDPDGTAAKANDLCGMTLSLKAPFGAKGFAFDFIFFSAEYPEWVGTEYNDTFNVMMDSQAFQNQNIAFDKNLKPISINVAFFTICDGAGCAQPGSALAGTGYDGGVGGSTGWLTTTVPVVAGETVSLRFVIYDEGDHIFDSDVLLNNFRWVDTTTGTGPVTTKD